jgi:hypothetical protein
VTGQHWPQTLLLQARELLPGPQQHGQVGIRVLPVTQELLVRARAAFESPATALCVSQLQPGQRVDSWKPVSAMNCPGQTMAWISSRVTTCPARSARQTRRSIRWGRSLTVLSLCLRRLRLGCPSHSPTVKCGRGRVASEACSVTSLAVMIGQSYVRADRFRPVVASAHNGYDQTVARRGRAGCKSTPAGSASRTVGLASPAMAVTERHRGVLHAAGAK